MSGRLGAAGSVIARASAALLLGAMSVAAQDTAPDTVQATAPATAHDEAAYWTVDYLVPPEGEVLEVGGLDFDDEGRLYVSTRRGQVWVVENPDAEDPADAQFSLFADGLHEGLGLHVTSTDTRTGGGPRGGAGGGPGVYVMQRGELSRLEDRDGDGRAEVVTTLVNDWGVSGNYHEFGYGLPPAPEGGFYASLNVGFHDPMWWHGISPAPYRGWVVRLDTRTGKTVPVAPGLRSPNGLGTNGRGELFVTDNQGDWMPVCPVFHIQEGRFYGHPASLDWTDDYLANDAKTSFTVPPDVERAPAALWLPYKWSRSPGNPIFQESQAGQGLGPFAGQMFIGELTNGLLLRADLEKVRGEYQGVVFMQRQQIGSIIRLAFSEQGTLFAGMTNRGWGGLAPNDGVARIRWTGKVPMEMSTVRLSDDGFDVLFTKPLAAGTVVDPSQIALQQYDYDWWWEYGSPERHTTEVAVTSTALSSDRRTLHLTVPELKAAMVARAVLADIVAADGTPLLHDEFAYTVNQLLSGPPTREHVAKEVPPPPARTSGWEDWLRLTWGDAFIAWDSTGWELVEAAVDPDDETTFVIEDGNGALVNAADGSSSDFHGRWDLGSGRYVVEFMLPRGGRSTFWIGGRYGFVLSEGVRGGSIPALGTITASANSGPLPPALDAYRGPGQWHELVVDFEAPSFDAAGRKLTPARLQKVTVNDVLLHAGIDLPGPGLGAPLAGGGRSGQGLSAEAPAGPMVIAGGQGRVALRGLRFRPAQRTTEPTAEERAGWVSLFNGEDLGGWRLSPDGWHGEPDVAARPDGLIDPADPDEPPRLGGWSVEDGVLTGTGERSHLFSPRGDYTDLEFRAKVRINDGGNSGMYFRVTYGEGWPAGYEAQVNSTFQDPVKSGSLYGLDNLGVVLIPPGTWFTQHITCRDVPEGTHITIAINGVRVVDFIDTERRHAAGHVALQQHHEGSVVDYRDLEVRVLR